MMGRAAIKTALLWALAAPPAALNAGAPISVTPYGNTKQLSGRFLAALHAAWNPESYEHADLLAEILESIERDYGYNLHSGMLRGEIAHRQGNRSASPEGIAHYRPLETDRSKTGLNLILEADFLTARCLPSEVSYNQRYLTFLERKRWPKENFESAPFRYALYLRMLLRRCLAERSFHAATQKLVPAIVKLMASESQGGDAGSYVYLLAASKRLDKVPYELLRRYLEAQRPDGSWPYERQPDAATVAAQGAYVIAAMLARNGVHVSSQEIFRAESIIPLLPEPVPFGAGRSMPP